MKWLSQRFTFVVIPDANQSVKRYRFSGLLIIMVPVIIALLASCSALFILLFSKQHTTINALTAQLSDSEEGYELILQNREEQIAALQDNLLVLSEQAEQIEGKMTEITELELQLKEIAGIKEPAVHISSNVESEDGGQGGEQFLLPSSSGNNLVSSTMQSFTSSANLMEAMKPSLEATKAAVVQYQHILDITPSIWPADSRKITSTFGTRRDPITGRRSLHNGLDLGGNRGEPIYATATGVVTLSERTYPQGNNVIINHGRGIQTRYLHLNKRLVEVGDTVTKGQIIGELGNTGRSTGPHLHYEVIVNGTHVDPITYITEDGKDDE